MDGDHYTEVKRLFVEVAELPEGERAARLAALSDDPEVVAEVLSLLEAGEGSTLLGLPIAAALGQFVGHPPEPGDTLGVWHLEREIGRGGMGSVYLAERSDGHFRQRAAVKVLAGLPRAEALALLARERQLLANLSHRNIARLLDGGATAQGQPFLVMEYVEGDHIDSYCRRQRAKVREVLVLFVTVCDAVAFAHRQLVVHCDLKPSNVLVDGEGRPVLLDFGIARLLDRVGAESAGGGTAGGPRSPAFTPGYASPEQKRDGSISTASDVYSLGVLLRELLAEASDRAHLSRLGLRELEAIVDRSTREEAAERYAGADELSADLRRLLDQRPVRALEGSPGYALRKRIARRWPWLAMAALFLATVGLFTLRLVAESRRAHGAEEAALHERDRSQGAERRAVRERDATRLARAEALRERDGAERARRQSEAERDRAREAERGAVRERNRAAQAEASARRTGEFLVSIFDDSRPDAESGDVPASRLLARAESRLDGELAGQDATRAELFHALARVQGKMGNPERARADARRAIALERKQDRPLVLAEMLHHYAVVVLQGFGTPDADDAEREALALRARHAPESEAHAESLASLGIVLTLHGKREEAAPLLERSLRIRERIDPRGLGTAESLESLAALELARRDRKRAIELYRRALALREAKVGTRHPDYLVAVQPLARALTGAREYEEAEALLNRALVERRRLHGEGSTLVAELSNQLATVYSETGRDLAAIPLYREYIEAHRRLEGPDSVGYGIGLFNLAMSLQNLGDDEGTVAGIREALGILTRHWTEPDPQMALMRTILGRSLMNLGRLAEGEEELEKALAARIQLSGPGQSDALRNEVWLAECELRRGELEAAAGRFARVEPLAAKLSRGGQRELRQVRALLLAAKGDVAGAERELVAAEEEAAASGFPKTKLALGRVYRAELLIGRGDPGQKEEGRLLARRLLDELTPLLLPGAAALDRLHALIGAPAAP